LHGRLRGRVGSRPLLPNPGRVDRFTPR
jgi:hypothetical protein